MDKNNFESNNLKNAFDTDLGSSMMTSSNVTMFTCLNSFSKLISLNAVDGIPSSSFSSLKLAGKTHLNKAI